MRDTVEPDTRAAVRLRVEAFAAMWRVVGATTNDEIAAQMEMSSRQIRRVRNGEVPAGEVFIARTLASLRPHARQLRRAGVGEPTFDNLFEVA